MKYLGPNVRLSWIVVAAVLSTGVFASARADQVVLGGPRFGVGVSESRDALDVTFMVNNTGLPDKVAVNIGLITETVSPHSGDTKNDVLSDGSIEKSCGTLRVRQTCDVVARYDVLDGDPFDLDKTLDQGVWIAGIIVHWTTIDGMHSGSATGWTTGIVSDGQARFAIPEPSTWVELLAGFSALGFAGYRRARSRQALNTA